MKVSTFLAKVSNLSDVEVAELISHTVEQLRQRALLSKGYHAVAPNLAKNAAKNAALRAAGFRDITLAAVAGLDGRK